MTSAANPAIEGELRWGALGRLRWDVYCRVIDNHGDLGVCWRLAADLAGRGDRVRLWVDDASALSWMAPDGAACVEVRPWPDDALAATTEPGDVVIEAFGCALPRATVARLAAADRPPVWINLEYLSAEAYVERSHRLASPQSNGMRKWFFYPGFTARTGGLLREPDLIARQAAFDAPAWLGSHGIVPSTGAQVVSLFCYAQPALPALLTELAREPTLLLATPGPAATQVSELLGPGLSRGLLRAALLPALTQRGFDELLWACDLNLVRGEDSFVRAQWAGRPFLWQIYPQDDGAHHTKLSAFLSRFLQGAGDTLATSVRAAFEAWNAGAPCPSMPLPPRAAGVNDAAAWAKHTAAWRQTQLGQDDLATQLRRFVLETR